MLIVNADRSLDFINDFKTGKKFVLPAKNNPTKLIYCYFQGSENISFCKMRRTVRYLRAIAATQIKQQHQKKHHSVFQRCLYL